MKKSIYSKAVLCIFVIASLLTSCSIKKTENAAPSNMADKSAKESAAFAADQSAAKTQEIKLSDVIELHYKEIK